MYKKVVTVLIAFLNYLGVNALTQPIEIDGLYYYVWQRGARNVASLCPPPNGDYDIANIVVPDNITYDEELYDVIQLEENAFMDCQKIKSIHLGKNITQIWGETFWNSSVENIYFPDNNELRVDYSVFLNCNNLDSLVFNSKVTTLVTSWYIPTGIKKIIFNKKAELVPVPTAGINQKKLSDREIDIMQETEKMSVPEIKWSPISNLALVHSLSYYGVEKMYLPNKVVLQGNDYAGVGLPELTTLELAPTDEATIAQLMDDAYGVNRYQGQEYYQLSWTAFIECKKLTTIVSYGETPWTVAPNAFASDEAMKAITLYVPETAIDTYKAHPVWGKMGAILPIDNGVEDITTDENGGAVEYFDMQGRRLNNPRPGTLVIRRQGSIVTKLKIEN